jgi:hypothetical protein
VTNWQVTAKTIFCDSVDDEVTVMVYKDGSTRCTGSQKYNQPNSITKRMIKKKVKLDKRPIKCEGDDCSRVPRYRDKILSEESK